MRVRRTLLATAAAALLAGAGLTATTGAADAAPTYAPASSALIHPGTMMYTAGAQCTANFVYTDGAGNVYVGYAAHCAGTGVLDRHQRLQRPPRSRWAPRSTSPTTATSPPRAPSSATARWPTAPGSPSTSSAPPTPTPAPTTTWPWSRSTPADVSKVNPSVPFWGGPTGIDTDGTAAGDRVCTYGNSSLRAGLSPLSPHTGISLGDDAADGGWSHPLYTVSPGIPGDSGSGFMTADGKAIGVLSTLGLAPLPGVEQHRRPGQGAGLRPGALRHLRSAAGQRHGAVLHRFSYLSRIARFWSTPRTRAAPVLLPGKGARCVSTFVVRVRLPAATHDQPRVEERNGEGGVRRARPGDRRTGAARPGHDVRRHRGPHRGRRTATGGPGDGAVRRTGALVARRPGRRVAAAQHGDEARQHTSRKSTPMRESGRVDLRAAYWQP